MSQENLETMRRAVDASNRGDMDEFLSYIHPDAEWVVAREHPQATTHRGRGAIRRYLRDWQEMLDPLRFAVDRFVEAGDTVISIGHVHGQGKGSGVDVKVPIAYVSTFQGGSITRTEEYLDPTEALEAAELSE